MQLPINEKPTIRLYPEYMFLDIIINNSTTTDKTVASISLKERLQNEWQTYTERASVCMGGEKIKFEREGFDLDSIKVCYRTLHWNEDQVEFHICSQQYTNRWDSLLFFINIGHAEECFSHYPGMTFVLGRYCCQDVFFMVNGDYHWVGIPDGNTLVSFRFIIKKGHLHVDGRSDGSEWKVLWKSDEPLIPVHQEAILGCMSCQSGNQYDNWKFNNFIQYKYAPAEASPVNYIDFIKRDSKIYGIHPFVRFSEDDAEIIANCYHGIWEYTIAKVQRGQYVQLILNEAFVPGSERYQKINYKHENLFYGYDVHSQRLLMIHIYQGKPILMQMSKENLECSYCGLPAVCMMFSPRTSSYTLDVYHIYSRLHDYLSGRNSSEDHSYLAEADEGVFGIDVYEKMMEQGVGQEIFLKDVRVPYMLYEHKLCMKERFSYFYEMGLIPDEIYTTMQTEMNVICAHTQKIMLLHIKNMMMPRSNVVEKMWCLLNETRELEKRCYNRFLALLDLL